MRILYFGSYDRDYARNRVLIKGLKKNGVEVLECQDGSPGLKKFLNLYKKHKAFKNKYDAMVVGFLGHVIVPLAKVVSRKPVIFDAFVSLYDSNVADRKLVPRHSLKAWYYRFLDRFSMNLADIVLFDTNEHVNYAVEKIGLKKEKVKRVFVGTDDAVFYPREPGKTEVSSNPFTVHFHGSFIPLQGIDCIIKSAKLVEEDGVRFNIVGDGQTYPEIRKLAADLNLKNLNFINRVEYDRLPEHIDKGDICLGIFGKTGKAKRVIPNKVYEYAAMKKAIVTSDTPAVRELFDDRDMVLIRPTPENLASAITGLKNNPALIKSFSENAHRKVKSLASPEVLGKELKNIIQKIL